MPHCDIIKMKPVKSGTKYLIQKQSKNENNLRFLKSPTSDETKKDSDIAHIIKIVLGKSDQTTAPLPPENNVCQSKIKEIHLLSQINNPIKKKQKRKRRGRGRKRFHDFGCDCDPLACDCEPQGKRMRKENEFPLPNPAKKRNQLSSENKPCNNNCNIVEISEISKFGNALNNRDNQNLNSKISECKSSGKINNIQKPSKLTDASSSDTVESYFVKSRYHVGQNKRENIVSPDSTGITTQSLIHNRDHRGTCSKQNSPLLSFSLSDISVPNTAPVESTNIDSNSIPSEPQTITISSSSSSNSESSRPQLLPQKRFDVKKNCLSKEKLENIPSIKDKESEKLCLRNQHFVERVHDKKQPQESRNHVHCSNPNKEVNSRSKLDGKEVCDSGPTKLQSATREVGTNLNRVKDTIFSDNVDCLEKKKYLPEKENDSEHISGEEILQKHEPNYSSTNKSSDDSKQNEVKSTGSAAQNQELREECQGRREVWIIEEGESTQIAKCSLRKTAKPECNKLNTSKLTSVPEEVKTIQQNHGPDECYPSKKNEVMENTCNSVMSNLSFFTCVSKIDISLPLTPEKNLTCDVSTEWDTQIENPNASLQTSKGSETSPSNSSPPLRDALKNDTFSEMSEYLVEESKKCLAKVVQMLSICYDAPSKDCVTILQKNGFNILTTLQELQLLVTSSSEDDK